MKKIITSILITGSILSANVLNAQTTRPFELGFNAGASWQSSDIKMQKLGGGGGFTFGRMYLENDKSIFDIGWRFRYLNAVQYGQDDQKSTGIANNVVLNGTTDTALNYNSHGGYVYQNYKTTLNECSVELVIGLNQMRNKTKFYPYVFGGLGITKAITKTNQLNDNGQRYNYAKVDSLSAAGNGSVASNLNNLYDGSYETTAEGSRNPSWKFMPSLGLGLGYQITKVVSFGLEYKMTWALSDQLDGQQWSNDNTRSLTNDKYYYASAWLKFSFGRKPKPAANNTTNTTTTTTNPNIYTNTIDKPSIVMIDPNVSPFTSTQRFFTVKATITNVNSKSDISFISNGISNSDFIYDPFSHMFSFSTELLNGNNSFMITAQNIAGNTISTATIIFEEPIIISTPTTPAPVITITNPTSNPFNTPFGTITLTAKVFNVEYQNQISVSVNGSAVYGFVFNPSTHSLSIPDNLIAGANSFVITAANSSGNDSKSATIIYNKAEQSPPPVIIITSPSVDPYSSANNIIAVTALVQNVTALGEISVTVNGTNLPTGKLFFNTSNGQLNFNVNLIAGANAVVISATNIYGADSKSETIIYSPQVVEEQKPLVTVTSPTTNPYNTSVNSAIVDASVLNINYASQIAVSVNGTLTSAFTFNVATKQLSLSTGLILGSNLITITATNSAGADSRSQTIIYTQPVTALPAPVITIISPATNPFNTSSNTSFVKGTVLNVLSASQISISLNGNPSTAFGFNIVTKAFSFPVNLIVGANLITIKATNVSGADTKSQTIIYTQPVVVPAPVVTITSPSVPVYTCNLDSYTIEATVLNVASSSEISVKVNGAALSTFSYSLSTKKVTFTVMMGGGPKNVIISATNAGGTSSKAATVNFVRSTGGLNPDTIAKTIGQSNGATTGPMGHKGGPANDAGKATVVFALTNPYSTTAATVTSTAVVNGVINQASIVVKMNAVVIPFTYNIHTKTISFSGNLNVGANTLSVAATNTVGVKTATLTITRH